MIEWREPPAYKVRTFYTLLKILPSKIPDLLKNIPFSGIQWFLLKPIRNQVKHLLKLFKWMGFGKIQKYLEMGDKFFEGQNKKENGQGTYTQSNGTKHVGEFKN